jgi:hypothetical protein
MRKTIGIALILFFVAATASAFAAQQAKSPVWEAIKGPGKKNRIADKIHFTFKPTEKPKVGTVNLRVQILDKTEKKDKTWVLKGAVSLAGEAVPPESAFKTFTRNKAGLYVLPLTIAKSGQWEFRLIIQRDGKIVYRGMVKFVV